MTYSTYTHKYLVKNSTEVLENAYINWFQGSDKIHSLGENKEFDASQSPQIIVPGFINLHAHLAYNSVNIESQPLFSWLKELYKKTFLDKNYSPRSNVLDSIDDLLKFGTTFIVDNCFHPENSFAAISEKGIKALIGIELFGSDPKQADEIFKSQLELIEKFQNINPNIELCFSPHAVYDVSKELWQKSVEWSKENDKILLSHIAESKEEEFFMQDINHPELKSAKEFWASINSLKAKEENWQSYVSSVDFLASNNLLFEKLILAHAVQCSNQDLEKLKQASVKLVNCPRSNEYLHNGKADSQSWQKLGIEFAMGTDSKASNYDLDIRKEVQKNTHLTSKEKFDKLTIDAAKILGRDQDIGSLEKNKAVDFVVLEPKKQNIKKEEVLDLIVDPELTRVKEVFINGKKVYSL